MIFLFLVRVCKFRLWSFVNSRTYTGYKEFYLDIRFTFARSLANHFPSVSTSKRVQNPRDEYRKTRTLKLSSFFKMGNIKLIFLKVMIVTFCQSLSLTEEIT